MEYLELASTSFGIMLIVKTTIVLTLAFLAAALLRTASAATKHAVWSVTFICLLGLPAAAYLGPTGSPWRVAVPILSPLPPAPASDGLDTPQGTVRERRSELAPTEPAEARTATSAPMKRHSASLAWWQLAWMAGTSAVGLRLLFGLIASFRIAGRSRVVTDESWRSALEHAKAELGVARPVRLLSADGSNVPVTLGVFRAAILLPPQAADYHAERRRAVLLHELAHIRRHDCLTQWLCQAACALLWWHPLVWVAAQQMRALSERASDDLVLHAGTPASDYAHDLLEMAKSLQGSGRTPLASVTMAHRSRLEERLLAILDEQMERRRVPARLAVPAGALGAAGLVAIALAAPTRAVAPEASISTPAALQSASTEPTQETEPESEAPVAPATPVQAQTPDTPESSESAARRDALERARQALADALDDPDPEVREQSLQTLTRIGDARSIPYLERALASDNAELRAEAAWGLGKLRHEDAVAALGERLTSDSSAEVRSQASWALGMIRSASSVPALIDALDDEDDEVKSQSAWALGMIRDETAVDGLVGALGDAEAEVRSQAAWALGMIRDERAAPGLAGVLDDPSAEVGEQAVWALGMIRSEATVDPLIGALDNPHVEIRRQAAWALGRLRSLRAVDALIAATKDDDAEVREQALWALGRLAREGDSDAHDDAVEPDFDVDLDDFDVDLDNMDVHVDPDVDPDPDPDPDPRRVRPIPRGADF